jgi:ABC-type lipoprotein release transport system permease subunit
MRVTRVGFWVRIAFFFLIRSGRSTAALSIMVVTAVAALIFLSALSVGVEDAMLRNTVGLYSGHITGYNLTGTTSPGDLKIKGVDSVLNRSFITGVISAGGYAHKIQVCGCDPEMEARQTALAKKVIEGRYPLPDRNEILVSRYTADLLNIHTDDRLGINFPKIGKALTYSVSGIFQTGMDMLDQQLAFTPSNPTIFKDLPWSAAVFLKTGVNTDSVIETYRERYPAPVRFESWEDQMPDLRQLIDLEAISMTIIIVLVFSVVAIGIACSFIIFIIRNMREYGILKAMGVTAAEISIFIMTKVFLMNVLACAAGLMIGIIAVAAVAHTGGIDISPFTSHNRYFTVSGVILPRLTMISLWTPPAIALLFGLIASLWPAAVVTRKRAADILRMV